MSETVAFIVHGGRQDAMEAARETASRLEESGLSVGVVVFTDGAEDQASLELAALSPSLIVSLGGDGTFLRAAKRAHELDVPILGVNFGRVGYLLDVPPAELDGVIRRALEGHVVVEERLGLAISVREGPLVHETIFAVNEVSVEKTVPGHVVRLAAGIDGEPFKHFSADGVLIASPMGSTAYNHSAGGPVLSPDLDGFVMTPVAPHFVIDRSVVLSGDQVVSLDVVGERPAVCVVDGVSIATLTPGDRVECRREPRRLHVVTLAEPGLGRRLRESLRQGHE